MIEMRADVKILQRKAYGKRLRIYRIRWEKHANDKDPE